MIAIFRLCKKYLIERKWLLAAHIALCLLVSLSEVILPYLSGSFIDALCAANNNEFIWKYAVTFFVVGVIGGFAGYLSKRLYYIIQVRSSARLNMDAVYRVQNVTSQYVRSKDTAFLNQQINNDACDVIIFCINTLHEVPSNGLTLLLSIAVILQAQPRLGFVMILLNVLYYFIYLLLRKPLYQRSYQTSESQLRFFAKLDEQLSNVRFLQVHGISRRFVNRLGIHVENLLRKVLEEQNVSYCFTGSNALIKIAANIFVFFMGGTAVIENRLSIGSFTILMSYFTMSMAATNYFFNFGKTVQESMVACDRLQKIFNLKEQTTGPVFLEELNEITCEDVHFGYIGEEIFNGLNLHFQKGKKYALVGENGAGKSTLIQLLLGIYVDEYQGKIAYNGIPIEKLDMPRIRDQLIGVSEQEPNLLPETILFNLTLDDNSGFPQKDFEILCGMLDLNGLISNLPSGLDTLIAEGTCNLSGGEKQKLSILRALLKKPKLLILDEPTSALDRQSRWNLCEFLRCNSADKIVIISTHDAELLKICDEVITIAYRKKE